MLAMHNFLRIIEAAYNNLRVSKEEMGLVLMSILNRQVQHLTTQKQLHTAIRPFDKPCIALILHTPHHDPDYTGGIVISVLWIHPDNNMYENLTLKYTSFGVASQKQLD